MLEFVFRNIFWIDLLSYPTYLTREGFGLLNLFRNELEVGGTIQNLGDT